MVDHALQLAKSRGARAAVRLGPEDLDERPGLPSPQGGVTGAVPLLDDSESELTIRGGELCDVAELFYGEHLALLRDAGLLSGQFLRLASGSFLRAILFRPFGLIRADAHLPTVFRQRRYFKERCRSTLCTAITAVFSLLCRRAGRATLAPPRDLKGPLSVDEPQ